MLKSAARLFLLGATLALCAPSAFAEQSEMTSKTAIQTDIKYLLYKPKDYATSQEQYPLVVWLHGGDQGGSDLAKLKTSGLPKMIEEGRDFPFLVFSPQNPSEELLFPIERVESALNEVLADNRVDRSRIYLMGYSRGGFGAWAMAEQFPQMFAAVVPIAGGGNQHYLNRTNENAAFWVFHGTDDETIPLSDSVVLFEHLKALKRDARLTVFEGVSHETVEAKVLEQKDLWDWLLDQRLDAGSEPATP